ncbi:transmembrane protein 59-like isoform X1 [Penaeus chinensis]|uniref:transmembrane protein 59-like isoform X1 n=1 Tax=Penaeus chinensis TaxID=139456 RepID=UPI001FB7F097|nr:transmembrane protein 59-like isoform X1 [Penaeus chinensis]
MMAAAVRRTLLLLSLFALCLADSPFDRILDDVTPCEESCATSYSPHTNPSSSNNDACERGCRFYTISEFVSDGPGHGNAVDGKDANPVKTTCYNSCVEAYNETSDSTVACKAGCDAQERTSQDKTKEEEEEEKPTLHLLKPLMQMQAVYSSIVGAVHIVRTSLVTYFVSDDSSIVAVESEPEIMLEILPEGVDGDSPMQGLQAEPRQLMSDEDSQDPSVVRCVSRHLGVPPYLLVASALALVLFTLYVIFAVCTTASPPKTKTFKNGLSVQADPLPLPIKLVRPEDLTKLSLMEEEEQQAPPLPTKVKLPDTEI